VGDASVRGGTNLRLLILKSRLRKAAKDVSQGKTDRAIRDLQEISAELKEMLSEMSETDSQRKLLERVLESVKKQLAKNSGG
jgi:TRAP-type C4-dicarboxylate transport system substrate-binding protein